MNLRNQYDHRDCLEMGESAEAMFAELAERHGWSVTRAASEADIDQHWDYAIAKDDRRFLVDVKAMKRVSRRDPSVQDQWLWVELHGVRLGDKGWLFGGKADLLAVETRDAFVIVERQDLARLVQQLVEWDRPVPTAREAHYRPYRRSGRHDLLALIETSRLLELKHARWPKES